MSDGIPLRVFVATPGDLASERVVVQTTIDEHNRKQANESTCFEMAGWESVRGTARRPQEAINELIGECHYIISIFRKSWGSEPGSPWGYTSGTEEELFTGLLQLGQSERPMRDVWVAFLNAAEPDPRITRLQEQMKNSHALMYEALADVRDFKTKLAARLEGWAAAVGPKVPRHIDLLPSSGKDLLKASTLRRDGEKLVELGLPDDGQKHLEEAAAIGGPPEQLAYAKFLEHAGNLDAAQSVIESAIAYFAKEPGTLHTPAAAEAFAALAGLFRRKGNDRDAIGRLQQALTLVREEDPFSSAVRCRILDELGLAHQQVGELEQAVRSFDAAFAERTSNGDEFGACQSLVNRARWHVAREDLVTARDLAEQALEILKGIPPVALHANAEVLRAQVLLRQGVAAEGLENIARAVAINRQIGNSRGEAIALLVSAQCHRALGDNAEAIDHAQQSLSINERIGDSVGVTRATWLIDQLRTQ
jgi:tetratricopeptide (TPR) repeat protein